MSFLRDIVTSDARDSVAVSSSKVWFNIANIAMTIVYLLLGYAVSKMAIPAIGDFAWLTLVYSGVVTTNKFANKFLDIKYAGKPGTTTTDSTSSSSTTVKEN